MKQLRPSPGDTLTFIETEHIKVRVVSTPRKAPSCTTFYFDVEVIQGDNSPALTVGARFRTISSCWHECWPWPKS